MMKYLYMKFANSMECGPIFVALNA